MSPRKPSLLPLFLVALLGLPVTRQARWQAVSDESGQFTALLQVRPRVEFWMRPTCVLLRSRVSSACGSSPRLRVRVSLWTKDVLQRAAQALRSAGHCRPGDRCRVLPLQALDVGISDQRGFWEAFPARTFVAGPLPPFLDVSMRPRRSAVPVANCSASASPLDGLVVEMAGLRAPSENTKLRISVVVPTANSVELNDTQETASILRRLDKELRARDRVIKKLQEEVKSLQIKTQALENGNSTDERIIRNLTAQVQSLTGEVKSLDRTNKVVRKALNISASQAEYPDLISISDCAEVKTRGLPRGVYLIVSRRRPVLCGANGELVALKRLSSNLSFDRNFSDYENGFGDPRSGDYWVGLSYLAAYTRDAGSCMKLTMHPYRTGVMTQVATYSGFRVTDRTDDYRLQYGSFSGNVSFDALAVSRGMAFSALDKDMDMFPGSCAKLFKSGNWYRSCYYANIFGPTLYPNPAGVGGKSRKKESGLEGMCWKGSKSDEVCSPLTGVEMVVKRVADSTSKRKLIFSEIRPCLTSAGCKSRLRLLTIEDTALFTITVGGAGGGRGYSGSQYSPGGRGAVVKISLMLTNGTRLAVVVGCGGRCGSYAGDGGNATIVADRTRGILLAIAGGGGGGSHWLRGMHGRASEAGGDGRFMACSSNPTSSRLLQRGFWDSRSGLGWSEVKRRVLGGSSNDVVGTGGRFYSNYGGGGGGYNGGAPGISTTSSGGGGGSYCNRPVANSCTLVEGGNNYEAGYILIQKHLCPF